VLEGRPAHSSCQDEIEARYRLIGFRAPGNPAYLLECGPGRVPVSAGDDLDIYSPDSGNSPEGGALSAALRASITKYDPNFSTSRSASSVACGCGFDKQFWQ